MYGPLFVERGSFELEVKSFIKNVEERNKIMISELAV